MEKENNLSTYCNTTAFEKTRKLIVRSIQENTNLEHIASKDQKGQVHSEILTVKDKNSRGQQVMFTMNIYRTKRSFLINGLKIKKIINRILPAIQSWAQVNRTTIEICNQ